MTDADNVYRVMLRRALASADPSNLQVHFETSVLDRYRGMAGFSLIRTDSVGRLRKEGGWSLDFGIAPGDEFIHVALGDLQRLPEDDRGHFAASAVLAPSSSMFLQMRLAPGSCFDDGEVRPWD